MPFESRFDRSSVLPRLFSVLVVLVSLGAFFCCGCSLWRKESSDVAGLSVPGQAVVKWKALPNLRCNLYRINPNGTQIQVNREPIEPTPGAAPGQHLVEYQFVDRGLVARKSYYYVAEKTGPEGTEPLWRTPMMVTAEAIPEADSFQ